MPPLAPMTMASAPGPDVRGGEAAVVFIVGSFRGAGQAARVEA
jgi:hypothetical protein